MFISNFKKELIDTKLDYLEARIKTLERKVNAVGEINITTWIAPFNIRTVWKKFSKTDIQDEYDDGIKVFNEWHDKKNVIFYNDYKEEKKKIEKRLKEKE